MVAVGKRALVVAGFVVALSTAGAGAAFADTVTPMDQGGSGVGIDLGHPHHGLLGLHLGDWWEQSPVGVPVGGCGVGCGFPVGVPVGVPVGYPVGVPVGSPCSVGAACGVVAAPAPCPVAAPAPCGC